VKRTLGEGLVLLLAAALLSLLAVATSTTSFTDAPLLLAALEAQVPVRSWRAGDELAADVLVVDGRPGAAHRAFRPKGALSVPFEERLEESIALPADQEARLVLVVLESGREAEARELAQWLAREWGLAAGATFEGGFEAWVEAGLPTERG